MRFVRDGAPGINGDEGTPGPKGDPGIDGVDGNDGASSSVTLGTVETGLAGSSVIITNSGTPQDAVFNFTIPRGDKGEQGPSKRIVTASITTAADGTATVTFSPAFPSTPRIAATLITTNTRQFVRVTAVTASSCSVHAYQQNTSALSLLGLDIITAGTTNINAGTVMILALEA